MVVRHPTSQPAVAAEALRPITDLPEPDIFNPVRAAAEKESERVEKAAAAAALHGVRNLQSGGAVGRHVQISPKELTDQLMPHKSPVGRF